MMQVNALHHQTYETPNKKCIMNTLFDVSDFTHLLIWPIKMSYRERNFVCVIEYQRLIQN